MMRATLLGAVSAAALIVSANAADIYRTPESPGGLKDGSYVPVTSWAGFYVGANGGFGWSNGDAKLSGQSSPVCLGPCQLSPIPYANSFSPSVGFGGGQIGYNIQRHNFVFGVEADIDGSTVQDSVTFTSNFIGSASARSDLNWFGTARGRIGYGFDRSLVYFTGGLAFGGVKDTLSTSFSKPLTLENTKTGYVVGGGIEYSLAPSWSVKAEYQYIDLGSDTLSVSKLEGSAKLFDPHTYNTVRAGLNYHIHNEYEPLK
jgi:outer membrane immunogenic protein